MNDESTVEEVADELALKMPNARIVVQKECSRNYEHSYTAWTIHVVFDDSENNRRCFICRPIAALADEAVEWYGAHQPVYS